MGPSIYLRIKTPDVGIPMPPTKYEVKATDTTHQLSIVMRVDAQ